MIAVAVFYRDVWHLYHHVRRRYTRLCVQIERGNVDEDSNVLFIERIRLQSGRDRGLGFYAIKGIFNKNDYIIQDKVIAYCH